MSAKQHFECSYCSCPSNINQGTNPCFTHILFRDGVVTLNRGRKNADECLERYRIRQWGNL